MANTAARNRPEALIALPGSNGFDVEAAGAGVGEAPEAECEDHDQFDPAGDHQRLAEIWTPRYWMPATTVTAHSPKTSGNQSATEPVQPSELGDHPAAEDGHGAQHERGVDDVQPRDEEPGPRVDAACDVRVVAAGRRHGLGQLGQDDCREENDHERDRVRQRGGKTRLGDDDRRVEQGRDARGDHRQALHEDRGQLEGARLQLGVCDRHSRRG